MEKQKKTEIRNKTTRKSADAKITEDKNHTEKRQVSEFSGASAVTAPEFTQKNDPKILYKNQKNQGSSGKLQAEEIVKSQIKDDASSSLKMVPVSYAGTNYGIIGDAVTTRYNSVSSGDAIQTNNQQIIERFANALDYLGFSNIQQDFARFFKHYSSLKKLTISPEVLKPEGMDVSIGSADVYINEVQNGGPKSHFKEGKATFTLHKMPDITYSNYLLNVDGGLRRNLTNTTNTARNFFHELATLRGPLVNSVSPGIDTVTGAPASIKALPAYPKSGTLITPYISSDAYNGDEKFTKIHFKEVSLEGGPELTFHPGFATSTNVKNKALYFRNLMSKLTKHLAEVTSTNDSTSNSPLWAIMDERALAQLVNSVVSIKTMLYLIHDALNGAITSQVLMAATGGAVDSTLHTLMEINTVNKAKMIRAVNQLIECFDGLPIDAQVIDQWNSVKKWAKLNDTSVNDLSNSLIIPVFTLAFNALFEIPADNVSGRSAEDAKDISHEWKLCGSGIDLDTNVSVSVPLGAQRLNISTSPFHYPATDLNSEIFKLIFKKTNPADFVRMYPTNKATVYWDNQNYDKQPDGFKFHKTVGFMNWNELKDNVKNANFKVPTNDPSLPKGDSSYDDYIWGDEKQSNDVVGLSGISSNMTFDFTISYHTITGFMHAYVLSLIKMVDDYEALSKIREITSRIKPLFSILDKLSADTDPIKYNVNIPLVLMESTPLMAEPEVHTTDRQLLYPHTHQDLFGKTPYFPSRYNMRSKDDILVKKYSDYGRASALLGLRTVEISTDYKPDRDPSRDNYLLSVYGDQAKVSKFYSKDSIFKNTMAYISTSILVNDIIVQPTSFMKYDAQLNVNFYPMYIGNHAASMFHNPYCFQYVSPLLNTMAASNRQFIVNLDDGVFQSEYPGFCTQPYSASKLISEQHFLDDAKLSFWPGGFTSNLSSQVQSLSICKLRSYTAYGEYSELVQGLNDLTVSEGETKTELQVLPKPNVRLI